MAGKHRSRHGTLNTAKLTLRLPEALLVHLSDQATFHHHSVNEEILTLLYARSDPRRKANMHAELLALEPGPDDPRTDREIAQQMQAIHEKYEGIVVEVPEPDDDLDALDIDQEIEWLNPEKSFFT